jgi:cell division protein FtsI (penicillin-binding protein 3)
MQTNPMPAANDPSRSVKATAPRVNLRLRFLSVAMAACAAFIAVGAQLTHLAIKSNAVTITSHVIEAVPQSFARPDIIDRNGRLIATDVATPSLYVDPAKVLDRDELIENLATVLPDLDEAGLRKALSDRGRRFEWVRRGLSPALAQTIHNLGIPGLAFRDELKRAYPMGSSAGHVIGSVNVDNKGVSGIENYIDHSIGVDGVLGATRSSKAPVRLSLDIGIQHTIETELATAMNRYKASGAAALVMDVVTGEVLASASLPLADPSRPAPISDSTRIDHMTAGVYELGSIFKTITVALALEGGRDINAIIDTTQPLKAGRFEIKDLHPLGRPMTVAEVFTHSSNVGAAQLALEAGGDRHQALLAKLGLTTPMLTEQGPVALPLLPKNFDRTTQITVAYGHGLAVAPLQFAAAAAALVNGGTRVAPTVLYRYPDASPDAGERVVSAETSKRMAELMRLNVTEAHGTGRRADVPGYEVGGKTGTAEMPGRNGYLEKSVISSFIAAFPTSAPKYLVMVSLFEPHGSSETRGEITAGTNAAPTAGRMITRIGPALGLLPAAAVAEAD